MGFLEDESGKVKPRVVPLTKKVLEEIPADQRVNFDRVSVVLVAPIYAPNVQEPNAKHLIGAFVVYSQMQNYKASVLTLRQNRCKSDGEQISAIIAPILSYNYLVVK